MPIGVRGELFAGGDGLALGYLNDPKLTAEKFIPNPFRPDSLLYRTGDFARYRSDGNIEFIGRIDNQVKLRGYRIELGEIESVLKQHPAVSEAVVAAREDVAGDRRLVAYIAPASAAAQSGALREFLRERLPAYMLPAGFVFIDAFPLTPNGKLDRRALVKLDPPTHAASSSFSDCSRSTESMEDRLSVIWKSLLGTQLVGINDDFFELGGHSLLVSRLIARIEKEFGVILSLTAIFQAPTINKLARRIRRLVSPIDTDGKQPLFCAAYGLTLAQHLGWDQPVYQLYMDSESVARHSQIETLAAFYVDEIRKVQPSGPYFLSGYSAAGILAYEMAQQLLSQGEEMGLLAIVESLPFKVHSNSKRSLIRRLMRFTRRFPWRRPSRWFEFTLGKATSVLRRVIDRVRGQPIPAWEQISRLQAHYEPKPYSGRITLFLSDEGMSFSKSLREGWAKVAAGELEVILVPGDHFAMVKEPHVRVLAARIKERLP